MIFTVVFILIFLPAQKLNSDDVPYQEKKIIDQVVDLEVEQEKINKDFLKRVQAYDGKKIGQCVEFVQYVTGEYQIFNGVAGNIKPNAFEPKIGYAVITKEGKHGHVALVIDIVDNKLILAESNYNYDEVVHIGREISTNDELIIGYFNFDNPGGLGLE